MLIITDEVAGRICRQCGLAGPGKTEEQRNVALFPEVRGAVHRQHIFLRQQEVQHREHGLLQFPGVAHTGDQHTPTGKVDHHRAVAVGAIAFRVADELRRVDDLPAVFVARVVVRRADEQRVSEQSVPGIFRGHLNRQIVFRVGADMQFRDEGIALIHMQLNPIPERIEHLWADWLVDCTPIYGFAGGRLIDDETILRRASRTGARFNDDGAGIDEFSLASQHGELGKFGARQIGVGVRCVRRSGSGPSVWICSHRPLCPED